MIKIVENVDLTYDVMKYDVILVGCGIENFKSTGFQYNIAKNFRYAYAEYAKGKYTDISRLGTCTVIDSKYGNPIFVYCHITKGRHKPDKVPDMLDYDGMRKCLEYVAENFKDKKIATTVMGTYASEGGGDKEKAMAIINDVCKDLDLTIYDYEQRNYRYEDNEEYKDIVKKYKEGEIDKEEYYERKKKYIWKRKFGIYTPVPNMGYRALFLFMKDDKKLKKYIKDNKLMNIMPYADTCN